jgi:radical SAM enzyme (TIGR01210 family)
MKRRNDYKNTNSLLSEQVLSLRQKALKSRKQYNKTQLDRPITSWIKKDRLVNEIGKEFTIILRTKGCSWALNESGGCTMCGYIQDANIEEVTQDQIINQFDFALNSKIKEITVDDDNYIIKIFNSGSFFDENEISEKVRDHIYEQIANIDNIKEVVIESRVEFINSEKLKELNNYLKGKYIEVAIGLETVNDYIRNNYINKGMLYEDFKHASNLCKENNIRVKTYLLLKPPFLNEQGSIDDCISSINNLTDLNVNTISINPVNVQKGTLTEYLWYQNRYRPPWFYSLFKVLKKSLTKKDLNHVRILSDPSGAGTKRGIHNCLKRDCEISAQENLRNFILSQDLTVLNHSEFECDCKRKYQLQKNA